MVGVVVVGARGAPPGGIGLRPRCRRDQVSRCLSHGSNVAPARPPMVDANVRSPGLASDRRVTEQWPTIHHTGVRSCYGRSGCNAAIAGYSNAGSLYFDRVARRRPPSPGDVKVIPFVDDFLRARASFGDTLRVGRSSSCDKSRSWSDEIDSASLEMERAWAPTNSAVALSSAATAADTESGMDAQKAEQVESSMWRQPPFGRQRHRVLHQMENRVRAEAARPRRRCVSNASSTQPLVTTANVSP